MAESLLSLISMAYEQEAKRFVSHGEMRRSRPGWTRGASSAEALIALGIGTGEWDRADQEGPEAVMAGLVPAIHVVRRIERMGG